MPDFRSNTTCWIEGGIVCRVAGKPVRERVKDSHGHSYRFVGLAIRDCNGRLDVEGLKSGEWVVAPNLVYAFEALVADAD